MKKMSKGQKQIAIVLGVAVAAYLLYRYYKGQQSTAGSTQMVPGSATDPQYAALAGQEQSDMASLQRQLLALTNRNRSLGKRDRLEEAYIKALEKQIKALQRGKSNDRTKSVAVKKGGAFWNYYRRVTGHDPPANVPITNLILQLFLAGVSPRRARELFGGGKHEHPKHPWWWRETHHPGGSGWGKGGGRHGEGGHHHSPSGGVSPHPPHHGDHDPRHHHHVHHPNHGHDQRGGEHDRHRKQHTGPTGGASPHPHHNKGTRPSGRRR